MAEQTRFLDVIHDHLILGDGAMGTELFARGVEPERGVERMNLIAPDLVRHIHHEYVAAGSRVIETNTFGANRPNLARYHADAQVREIILAGARLARDAAAGKAFVAGALGPLPAIEGEPVSRQERQACFAEMVAALLDGGVDLLVCESFSDLDELVDAITVARSLADLPIVAQMAFGQDGQTAHGVDAAAVLARCREAGASVVGANCGYGATSVIEAIQQMTADGCPLSAHLNAGFPEQVEGRLQFRAGDEYLARCAVELAALGVRLIGGCCGTRPSTIRAMAQALTGHSASSATVPHAVTHASQAIVTPRVEHAAVDAPAFPVLVEFSSPANFDLEPLLAGTRLLQQAGVTAITVADNPLSSVRVDTLTVARMLHERCGVPVTMHLTGRDRNRLAMQSTIMGAHLAGIRSLLCVTGDPIRFCQEPNTSGVFDLTSVGLVRMVAEFNAGQRVNAACQTDFQIGVAVNPNVRTLSGQIDKLVRKVEAGAHYALTQPIFEEARLDALLEASAAAGIEIPIYPGILPLVSARNAEFLHNEVPGILIPDEIRARLHQYASVADQCALGVEIAQELAARFADRVPGLYIICPRNRTELVLPLLPQLPRMTLARP